MKRQRGRGRKPGGGGGGGGNHSNHGNRSLESNGPEVKIRGTAAQIYEKYAQYARDSQQGGDRVKYENYLQHAEHYFRLMAATMPRERLFQQQGEGGAPFQQQGQGGGEGGQPIEAGGAESADALKVVDDRNNDSDDDYDTEDAEEPRDGEDAVVGAQDDRQEGQDGQQGDRQGRRRRRGRRRPNEGDRSSPQSVASGEGEQQPQPRSALDSLARRQGAIAGS